MISNVSKLPLPDLYPPSQITDLEATSDEDEIRITWTAPGDDFDVGTGKDERSWILLPQNQLCQHKSGYVGSFLELWLHERTFASFHLVFRVNCSTCRYILMCCGRR